MKRIMLHVGFFMICSIVFTIQVFAVTSAEQDLQSAYQSEKKKLSDLLSQLSTVPDAVKKTWLASINGVLSKIDVRYQQALQAIKPYEPKAESTNLSDKLDALTNLFI